MINASKVMLALCAISTCSAAWADTRWTDLGQSDNGIRFAVSQDTPISASGSFTGRQRLTMPYPVVCADMESLRATNPALYEQCDQAMTSGVSVWIQHTQVDCQRRVVRGLYEEYINYKGESLGDLQLNEQWAEPKAGGFSVYLLNQYCGNQPIAR